ncbi:hypothetical protein PACTADRAFT_47678, partial [Pachysolen tannophilus NRRL Y-2460]
MTTSTYNQQSNQHDPTSIAVAQQLTGQRSSSADQLSSTAGEANVGTSGTSGTGSSIVGGNVPKTNSRKPYTEEEVFYLIDIYAKYTQNGLNIKHRLTKLGPNKTLNSIIAEEMTKKFPNSLKIFDKENIRKKLDEIKNEYIIFRYLLLKSSGFGWLINEGRFNLNINNLEFYKKDFVNMGGQLNNKTDTFKKFLKNGNFYIYHYHELIGHNLDFDLDFSKASAENGLPSSTNPNIEPELINQQQQAQQQHAAAAAHDGSASSSIAAAAAAAAAAHSGSSSHASNVIAHNNTEDIEDGDNDDNDNNNNNNNNSNDNNNTNNDNNNENEVVGPSSAAPRHQQQQIINSSSLASSRPYKRILDNSDFLVDKRIRYNNITERDEENTILEFVLKLTQDDPEFFKFNQLCALVENYRLLRRLILSNKYDYTHKQNLIKEFI